MKTAFNLASPRSGNPVPNQIVTNDGLYNYFVSYGTVIARYSVRTGAMHIDEHFHNYSRTTAKYLREFLKLYPVNSDRIYYINLQRAR